MSTAELVTGITQGGKVWVPQFAQSIDAEKCIGCGRCYKVCGRDVMHLVGMDDAGVLVEIEEDEEDEFEKKVMVLAHPENCVGCEACSRVCPKKCYTHGSMQVAGQAAGPLARPLEG